MFVDSPRIVVQKFASFLPPTRWRGGGRAQSGFCGRRDGAQITLDHCQIGWASPYLTDSNDEQPAARYSPMSPPRLLVIEGNTAEGRAQQIAAGGRHRGEGQGKLVRGMPPRGEVGNVFAGRPGAVLPRGAALEGYDGAAITGSALHIYEAG